MMDRDSSASGELYMGRHFMYEDTLVLVVKGFNVELQRILNVETTIDLSVNKFEGKIPDTIGQLRSLRLLNLSHNHLTGEIPIHMSNLTQLESLDLSSNKMVGAIPVQLESLSFLAVVNFSYNQFQGDIPQGGQFNTFGNDSFQGNDGLCGFPLTTGCGADDGSLSPTPVEEEGDEDSGFFNGLSWESVFMGYGFGLLIGSGVGWLVFYYGKPRWAVRITERKSRANHGSTGWATRRTRASQVWPRVTL
ncbi:hypothetical protein QVD17_34034 [Tagetes erecta]|uniref:Uncharacterized protein n=1 Tax=Tagetes erecta TaxID=13708 RepID=A0AAD8JZ75_TARER|nr:hypothetical protein QVD17_34034 [Tagetes erecta]